MASSRGASRAPSCRDGSRRTRSRGGQRWRRSWGTTIREASAVTASTILHERKQRNDVASIIMGRDPRSPALAEATLADIVAYDHREGGGDAELSCRDRA